MKFQFSSNRLFRRFKYRAGMESRVFRIKNSAQTFRHDLIEYLIDAGKHTVPASEILVQLNRLIQAVLSGIRFVFL